MASKTLCAVCAFLLLVCLSGHRTLAHDDDVTQPRTFGLLLNGAQQFAPAAATASGLLGGLAGLAGLAAAAGGAQGAGAYGPYAYGPYAGNPYYRPVPPTAYAPGYNPYAPGLSPYSPYNPYVPFPVTQHYGFAP